MLRSFPWLATIASLGLIVPGVASAAAPQREPDPIRQALWLKGKGQLDEAQELLSRWSELRPDSELIATARADLYLAQDNPFWALKVLTEFVATHPAACEAKTVAARVQIQQANLEQADELLKGEECDAPEALKVRRLLLRAELAELRGHGEQARKFVAVAEGFSSRYEEDDVRLAQLERAYDPYRLPLWTFELDAASGYVSTGLGQAPLEVITPASTQGSAIASLHLRGRVVLPVRPAFRPIAEIEFNGVEQLTSRPRELNLRQPVLRLGALLGRGYPRLQVNYAYELFDFDGSPESNTSGQWFSSAHRGEYRLELGRGLLSFGALGYRSFANHQWSRAESEQGLVKNWTLSSTLGVSSGATLRAYKANFDVFDQLGGTVFLGLTVQAPKGVTLQESVTLAHDHFPASAHYYAPSTDDRTDRLLRVSATVLSPEIWGLRLAASYGYVSRDSNVAFYDFHDHRALLELHYRMSSDEWRAKRISTEGRVPMHHEKETPKTVELESRSVRDALKQDEELRRGSSCLK
jgi:hypothetical protein